MKTRSIYLRYRETGERLVWKIYRDGRYWFLDDHNGYARTLEQTLAESVPRVQLIAENHGCAIVAGL